jgi:hypothetical protein
MTDTTKVSTSRLKDFELFTGRIGSLVPSYSSEPPAGMLRISVPNTEVSKTEWTALYEVIGGEDGSTSDTFVLPYKAKEGNLEYYLVGKIMFSDLVVSGNVISRTFTFSEVDSDGYFTFNHGINHLNPIIQVRDADGGQVLIEKIINMSGYSKLKISGPNLTKFDGSWTALAIG